MRRRALAAILIGCTSGVGHHPQVIGAMRAPGGEPLPTRIVSLVPAVTESLFAIGAGPRVVGVSSYDRHPAAVSALPKVGGLLDPAIERILELRPDLVVVYDGQRELMDRLARAHIRIFSYRHAGLADVTKTIRTLGDLVGRPTQAQAVAERVEHQLEAVKARVAGLPRPLTMLVFGREPRALRNIYVSGGRGFLHDMLLTAGGRDAFADIREESAQVSLEQILARKPDVIVELRAGEVGPSADDRSAWRPLSSLPAVKDGRVYEFVGDEFMEPGPRIAEATEALARALHPEAW